MESMYALFDPLKNVLDCDKALKERLTDDNRLGAKRAELIL
jgi:hypothetical protein